MGSGYNWRVKLDIHVAAPPAKPLMIYDGDCSFCSLWIRRWQHATGQSVDYLPSQDAGVEAQFPEIPREHLAASVVLILPDGSVFAAAEAVLRALAFNPHDQWLLDLYLHYPAFASVSEWAYRFVARHRPLFSRLTRLFWGRHVEPPSHNLVRWIFLRALGIIYLIAFVSLWVQIPGLVGSNGIVPASIRMEGAELEAARMHMGLNRYHLMPTLCWLSASDASLNLQCAGGTILAGLLVIGFAPAPCLFLLWLVYLSLTTIGGAFLGFQWDNLLLETGFLAIFFAPLQLLPRWPSREAPPSRIVLWLLRWLLFRLMFESGCVKLLTHDPAWRHLTALVYHYETQPLPTWIGWYAFQLPAWFQKVSAAVMFGIELGLPFLIFLPRRPRQFACLGFVTLQVLILLTGNYGFFNYLTIVLCLVLLDDAAIEGLLSRWRRRAVDTQVSSVRPRKPRWTAHFTLPLAAVVLWISFVQFLGLFHSRVPGRHPIIAFYEWFLPFRTFNSYGLFAVMTTTRPEIIVEGSNDGVNWQPYEFRYKPGDLKRRPGFVAPYQPRLDWQIWFAALTDYKHNPWFGDFCIRLLQGSPQVLGLLKYNPFPNAPPKYIRAVVYEYHFTNWKTRRETGDWWRREFKAIYLPPIALRETE